MAHTLFYFLAPEDELALLRVLEPQGLTLYPELAPPGYEAPAVGPALAGRLDQPAYYLAAERFGEVVAEPVKRGPDKGMLAVDEIRSPVFHYERSLPNEEGELVGGRLWAELDVTDTPHDRLGKPLALRRIFEEVQAWMRKTCRRSDPKGWWVGPKAAALHKSGGLVLREPGHKGRTYSVWR